MSIELASSDQEYPNEYHVRPNWCNCHPETCCCNDWAVHAPNGDKHSTYRHEEIAEEIADLLNRSDVLEAKSAELRKDAERYRWLRHGDNDEEVIIRDPFSDLVFVLRNEDLDSAIDAALAKIKEPS